MEGRLFTFHFADKAPAIEAKPLSPKKRIYTRYFEFIYVVPLRAFVLAMNSSITPHTSTSMGSVKATVNESK